MSLPTQSTTPTPPTRMILLSLPRTTSNLFMRLFSQSPHVSQLEYPFMWGAMWGPDAFVVPGAHMPEKAMGPLREQYKEHDLQSRLDVLEGFIRDCEAEGKVAMIKEHTQNIFDPSLDKSLPVRPTNPPKPNLTDSKLDVPSSLSDSSLPSSLVSSDLDSSNPTYLPTRLLATLTPTFIIRHPARILPSFMRAGGAIGLVTKDIDFARMLDYQFSRRVFDWYTQLWGNERRPVLIDADDLVLNTQELMGRYCKAMGLDEATFVKYDWEKGDKDLSHVHQAFLGTLHASSGVIRDEKMTKDINLEEEHAKWVEEFGEENAGDMKRIAEANMDGYNYMKGFKL